MAELPYRFRVDRCGRKGEPCRVAARSRAGRGEHAPALAFGAPGRPRFNSVLLVFADGFAVVTSGNFIRKQPK